MKKLIDNVVKLKKYFQLIGLHAEVPKAEILSSNEALKHFGKLWKNYEGDIMAMLAVIEYTYRSNKVTGYNEKEIVAVKNTLGAVAKFFKESSKEWQDYEKRQLRDH